MSAPDRLSASTTNTPTERPEIIRFLLGKFSAMGGKLMGNSETTALPSSAIC